jgi:hypothetical protein
MLDPDIARSIDDAVDEESAALGARPRESTRIPGCGSSEHRLPAGSRAARGALPYRVSSQNAGAFRARANPRPARHDPRRGPRAARDRRLRPLPDRDRRSVRSSPPRRSRTAAAGSLLGTPAEAARQRSNSLAGAFCGST